MRETSFQNITRIKLEELNKHYQRLRLHYEALEQKANEASALQDKLHILYDGLRELTFAQRKIHPEVENLEVVWLEIKANIASPAFVQYWVTRLEKEIAQGKQRLEAALLFGLLLEESAFTPPSTHVPQGRQAAEKHWEKCWTTKSQPDLKALKKWFEKYANNVEGSKTAIQTLIKDSLFNTITQTEMENHLKGLVADTYRHSSLKREIRQILGNSALIAELAGTVTIMLKNFQDWQWKTEDCIIDSTWTRNKWRPYHQNNLLDTLLLEIIGVRWGIVLKEIMKNTLFTAPSFEYNTISYYRVYYGTDFLLTMMPYTAEDYLYAAQSRYDKEDFSSEKLSVFDNLLGTLHKEITYYQTRHKKSKKEKLYITQIDIQDFFHTLPHEVLHEMLAFLGVPSDWLGFFDVYNKASYTLAGKVVQAKQGISLSHLLSTVLADVLLEWLKPAMQAHSVLIYRVMDDIYLLAPSQDAAQKSWSLAQDFFKSCGLTVNQDKCGATLLNVKDATKDAYLAQFKQLPQWSFLVLQPDGMWKIQTDKILAYQQQIAAQLKEKTTIFQMINSYNSDVGYLMRGIAPWIAWGNEHIEAVNLQLAQVHEHLFGENKGIFQELRQQIIARFPHLEEAIMRLPEAWFFFPVTAGGLALSHPICKIASLHAAQQNISLPTIPNTKDSSDIESDWANFYYYIVPAITANAPTSTVVMESLMNDFIARGGEVRGSEQYGLSIYWKWLLYTYGPQLLEAFGTFRFLLTELVPLQVIYQGGGYENETSAA